MFPTRCNLIGSIFGPPLLLAISLAIGSSAMAADAAIDKLMAEIRRVAGVAVGLTTGAADGGPSSSCVLSFADTADAEKTYTFPITAASASTTTTGVAWSCNAGPCIVPCKKQSTDDGITAPCDGPIASVQLPARRPMQAPLLASLFVKLRQFCPSPTRK
jgi:hypothetical protein